MIVTKTKTNYQKLFDNSKYDSIYEDVCKYFIKSFNRNGKDGNYKKELFYNFIENKIVFEHKFGKTFYMFDFNLKLYFKNDEVYKLCNLDKFFGCINKEDENRFSEIIQEKIQLKIKQNLNGMELKSFDDYQIASGYKDTDFLSDMEIVNVAIYMLTHIRNEYLPMSELPEFFDNYIETISTGIQGAIKLNGYQSDYLFEKYADINTAIQFIEDVGLGNRSLSYLISSGLKRLSEDSDNYLIIKEAITEILKEKTYLVSDFINENLFEYYKIDLLDSFIKVSDLDCNKSKIQKLNNVKVVFDKPIIQKVMFNSISVSVDLDLLETLIKLVENNSIVYIYKDDLNKLKLFVKFNSDIQSDHDLSSINYLIDNMKVLD